MEQIPLKHFTLKKATVVYPVILFFSLTKKGTGNHHQEVFSTFL